MLQADRDLLESLPEYQERKRQDELYQRQIQMAATIKRTALQSGYYLSKTMVEDAMMVLFPGIGRDRAHTIMNHIEMHGLDTKSA